MFAFERNVVSLENAHNAGRRGAAVSLFAHSHQTEAEAGDAVHVLATFDLFECGAFINVARNRVLQQNSVYVRIFIQFFDLGEEFFRRRLFRHVDRQTFHSHAGAGVAFHFDVSSAGRIVTHKNRGENRRFACASLERFNAFFQLKFGFLCEFFTVEDKSGHRFSCFS